MPYDLVIFAFGPACRANEAGYTVTPLSVRCEKQSEALATTENIAAALRPGYTLPCQIWAVVGHVPVRMIQQFNISAPSRGA